MKKTFMISVIALLLISCSSDKNVGIAKLDPKIRINRNNEAIDNVKNDTLEHISMKQDYQEVNDNESNVAEDYPLHQEDTEINIPLINPVKNNTEMDQVIKQPPAPPNQREVDGNGHIEVIHLRQ